MTGASRFPLETPCRLSRSVLWRLQRRYFERRGMAAWGDGEVPHWATCNPSLARAYGQVVLGFLRDWHARLDPAQPVYIVELGAGSGRLAFHFLRQFAPLLAGSALRGLDVRYVMTDFAERTLGAWRAHPALAPLLDAGRLDLARFDAEHDDAIALERAGATLAPGSVHNPVVVLANYVLDSLPVDGFSVPGAGPDAALEDWQVSVCSTRPDTDLDDPDLLARTSLLCQRRAVAPGPYYGDAVLDGVLDEHRAALAGSAFTFPTAALACLGRLSRLAGGRLLVLSSDKGSVREDALRGPGPHLTLHGSFSIAVNYHAIARFAQRHGGEALVPAEPPHTLASCAFLFGAPPGGYVEARQAYAEAIAAHGLDDLCAIKQAMARGQAAFTLAELTAYLRFTDHDLQLVADCLPALTRLAPGATEDERAALLRVLVRAWQGYFHIGEADDLGLALGELAAGMHAWREAIGFFEGSLRWYGRSAGTLARLAECHHQLGEPRAARARLDEALAIEPACEPARALRAVLA